jgi:hypothetical protein
VTHFIVLDAQIQPGNDLEKIETLQSSKSFKEGGYGWLVCFSAFLSNVVSFGVGTSWYVGSRLILLGQALWIIITNQVFINEYAN